MMQPRVIVCAGGGGVGKTTTSAALALALARAGDRALVVSLDPARRLGDALGVELGTKARELKVDAGPGALFGLMPDPDDALRTCASILFAEDPEALERLDSNCVYTAMEACVPGIHELAAIQLTRKTIVEHAIETVIIDTAPSRNAVDFLGYPRRLGKLLGSPALGWLSQLGQRSSESLHLRVGRVEALLMRAIGPAVRDGAALFAELVRVRERFMMLNEQAGQLLLSPNTQYLLVTAPTAASEEDAHYLMTKLRALDLKARAVILNSAFLPDRDWVQVLEESGECGAAMHAVLKELKNEHEIRERAADQLSSSLTLSTPGVHQVRLPHLELSNPRDIVLRLARQFDLSFLAPPGARYEMAS